MKALAFNKFGGIEELQLQDVPDPELGPNQVLIRVRACGLNHLDLFVRQGLPGLSISFPFWTGCDIAGDVAAVGSEVRNVKAGTRVAVNPNLACGVCEFCNLGEDSLCIHFGVLGEHKPGGLAELVPVDAHNVIPLPAHIDYIQAAAFILTNMTAWRMLITQGKLRPGQDVLILGVGGGVSSSAVQIASLAGARVIVTSSSDEKLERARALGASVCFNYYKEDWVNGVLRLTDKRGVDLVIENVGAATWKGSLRCVCKGGRIIICGATSGPIVETDLRPLFWRQFHIIGSTMANRAEFGQVMKLFFDGKLQACVDEVFPLSRGAEAQRRLEEGKQFGKLVITV
jgi:NADPH:quinone reductase-like Zn-dependent oxidoreductase